MAGRSIEASKVVVRFAAETKKARAEINSMERRLDSLAKRGRSVANFGAQLRGLGEGVNRFGRRITTGGVAAAAPFALAIKQAGDFERSISSIKVNLGDKIFRDTRGGVDKSIKSVGDLNKAYKNLGSTVRNIAKQFPKGPLDVAQTATTLARAGLDRKLIQGTSKNNSGKGGILRPIVQLSVADTAGADIQEVTEKTLALLKAFDLLKPQKTVGGLDETVSQQADRITRDLATMVKATTMANVSITSLAESMKFAGGIFAKDVKADKTGKAFREVIAVTSILQERLGDASIAGTALRGMMLRLQNPPKKVKEALAEVGFSMETMTDATGQSRLGLVALLKTIEQMRNKVAGGVMSDVEFQVFLGEIFENRQITGALSLIDETATRISKAVADMEIKGSPQAFLDDFTDELEDNISGAAGRAKSSLQDLAIEIGSAVSPQVQGAIAVFKDFVDVASKYVSKNPEIVTAFAAATAGALALGVAVAAAGAALSTLSLAVIASGLVMSKFAASAGRVDSMFASFAAGGKAIVTPFSQAAKAIVAAERATDSLSAALAAPKARTESFATLVGANTSSGMTLGQRLKVVSKEAAKARRELDKVEKARKASMLASAQAAEKAAKAEKAKAKAAAFTGKSMSDLKADEKAFRKRQREEKASEKRRRGVAPMAKRRRGGELAVITPKMPGVKALDLAFFRLAAMADIVTAEFTNASRQFTRPFSKLSPDAPAPRMNAEQAAIVAARDAAVARRKAGLAEAAKVAGRTSVDTRFQSSSKMTPSQIAAMLESDRKRKSGGGLIVQSQLVKAIRKLELAMGGLTAATVTGTNIDKVTHTALKQANESRRRIVDALTASTVGSGMVLPSGQMRRGASGLIAPSGAFASSASAGLLGSSSMSSMMNLRPVDMNIDRLAVLGKELDKVIGKDKSRKIVAALSMTGPIGSLSELTKVKGIGPATVKKLESSGRFTTKTLGASAFNPVAGLIGQRPDSRNFTMRGSTARNGEQISLLKAILAAMLVQNTKGITDQSGLFNKLPALLPDGSAGFTMDPSTPMRPSPVTGLREIPLIAATPGSRQAVNMGFERGMPGDVLSATSNPMRPGLPAPGQIFADDDPRAFGFTPIPGQTIDGRNPRKSIQKGRRRRLPRLMARMRSRLMERSAVEVAAMSARDFDGSGFRGDDRKSKFIQNRRFRSARGAAGALLGSGLGIASAGGAAAGKGLGKAAAKTGGASLKVLGKGFKGLAVTSGKFLMKLTAIGATIVTLGLKIAAVVGAMTLLLTSGNLVGNVFDAFSESLSGTFKAVKDQIGAISTVLGSLKFKALGEEAESTGDRINTFMRTLKNSLVIVLGEFAKEVPGMILAVGKAVINSIVEAMGTLFSFIADSISTFFGGSASGSNKSLGERFRDQIDSAIEGARRDQASITAEAEKRTAAGEAEKNERLQRITGFKSPELGKQAFEQIRQSAIEGFESGQFTVDDAISKLEEGADKVTFDALKEEAESIAASLVTPAQEFKAIMDRIQQMQQLGIIDANEAKRFGNQARTKFEESDPAMKAMREAAEEHKRAAEALIAAAKQTKRGLNPGFALQEDFKELSRQFSTGVLTLKEFQQAVHNAEMQASEQAAALKDESKERSRGFGSLGSTSGFFAKFSGLMGPDIDNTVEEETKKTMKATTGAMEELKGFVGGLESVFMDAKSGLGALVEGAKEAAKAMIPLGESASNGAGAPQIDPAAAGAAKKAGEAAGAGVGKAVGFLAGLIPGATPEPERDPGRQFAFLKDLDLGMFTRNSGRGEMANLLQQEGLMSSSDAQEILDREDAQMERRNKTVARASFLQEKHNEELARNTSTWRILRNRMLDFMGGVQPNRGGGGRPDPSRHHYYRGYMDANPTIVPGLDGMRANGGPVKSGGSYIVGEKGPELFFPTQSGHILSNDLSKKVDGMFADGTLKWSDINKQLHRLGEGSARDQLHDLIESQKTSYDANSPIASMLADRLTGGAQPNLSEGAFGQNMPSAKRGQGKFFIPKDLSGLIEKFPEVGSFGRAGARVHEFTHAFTQKASNRNNEIAPVMSDLAFAMESFRMQEGKQLEGMLNLPGGAQIGAKDYLSKAKADGFFGGRPMQEILSDKKSQLRGVLDSMKGEAQSPAVAAARPAIDKQFIGKPISREEAAATGMRGVRQNTNANRLKDRLGPHTGVQNTAANRFDFRSRAMTGLPEGVQNTNENRMRARLARQREQQQMLRDNAVSFGAFNPNFSRDAATAGANANNRMNGNGGADLAKDSTIETAIGILKQLVTATENGNTTL